MRLLFLPRLLPWQREQALGDRPDGQKYIETIPRRGYRFTAVVEEAGESAPAGQPAIADSGLEAKAPGSKNALASLERGIREKST